MQNGLAKAIDKKLYQVVRGYLDSDKEKGPTALAKAVSNRALHHSETGGP